MPVSRVEARHHPVQLDAAAQGGRIEPALPVLRLQQGDELGLGHAGCAFARRLAPFRATRRRGQAQPASVAGWIGNPNGWGWGRLERGAPPLGDTPPP